MQVDYEHELPPADPPHSEDDAADLDGEYPAHAVARHLTTAHARDLGAHSPAHTFLSHSFPLLLNLNILLPPRVLAPEDKQLVLGSSFVRSPSPFTASLLHDMSAHSSAPVKKKRVIKSRQSLAEKEMGTTMFPIARVKRIIKSDKDLEMMSAEATFLISVATEYFVKHFMEEGYTKARLEKRRIVNYKDMANVVSRSEEFDFLKDVIPMPVPMSEALERRKAKLAADESAMMHDDDRPRNTSEPAGIVGDSLDLSNAPEDLPPLALSTNPLYPNAIVKRPPNTHARSAMPQPSKVAPAPPPPPPPPRVHSGKNAPTTPHALATRSSRRSLNAAAAEPMQID